MMLQGESPLNSIDLVSAEWFQRYLAIDEVHFKAVEENKFKPINLVKLTTEMTFGPEQDESPTCWVGCGLGGSMKQNRESSRWVSHQKIPQRWVF